MPINLGKDFRPFDDEEEGYGADQEDRPWYRRVDPWLPDPDQPNDPDPNQPTGDDAHSTALETFLLNMYGATRGTAAFPSYLDQIGRASCRKRV